MVVCPNCGHQSGERFFCDRCRAFLPSSAPALLPASVSLPDGLVVDCSGFRGAFPADAWRPVESDAGGEPARVYAFSRSWWRELEPVVGRRAALSLDVLAPLHVVRIGEGALAVARGLPGASRPLLDPAPDDPLARVEDTLAACRLLERALTPLHGAGLVWLNFDPAGLLVAGGRVQVQPLDFLAYPAGEAPTGVPLSTAYSPPEVCAFRADRIGPATDVFHVALFAYYRLAGLLPAGFPGGGLEAFDFEFPPLRVFAPTLPPGIAPVVERGLEREPVNRHASVAEFVAALSAATTAAHARQADRRPVRVEAAGATAVGKMHVAMGLTNQDAFAVVRDDGHLFAVVADGVTLARIGSGEKASRLAVETLTRNLGELPADDDVPAAISEACVKATGAILDAALAVVPAGVAFEPCDLMTSTVVLAVVRGGEAVIACAGDSRAYLVTAGRAEQLTVDGDVRCVHLAAGWPPEEMRELGPDALALFSCLGIGEPGPAGRMVPCLDRCSPRVRRWKLLPGDVLVLCSDGLVEEGVYLEPADLVRHAAEHPSPPALADALVAAAVARHRDPSVWEPEGSGDDVTCVVIAAAEDSGPIPLSPSASHSVG
ncbi:MAG: PP2C family serine/threonine-protein phosphatase [Gemmataceae bacterium]